ncbi:ribose 5-phosphate isomerase B [Sporolactobacillus sp. KGMB 08714]|uniref:ribose 5-phosphate isomerase B n=1 Tax=Sporolactobacillus sp. KGMB 08714 TaxID=3064704 RepID=UPI002FBE4C38
MRIAIGCDHAGFDLKPTIKNYLIEKGIEIIDEGTYSSESVDYPEYAKKVAIDIISDKADLGILICGTGIGISIAANKIHGIRAVACSEPFSAKLSREHNNTNILAFGSRVIGSELAKMIIDVWLNAKFQGGRHQKRLDQMTQIEKDESLS